MRHCLVPPARVLVRMPSWLGDFVMAEPVVRALYERWARANCAERITLVGPARFLVLLSKLETDGVRFVPLERGATPDPSVWRGHDVALLLDGSWRSAWAAFNARVPERIGLASGGRSALLTQWIVPARERGGKPLGIGLPGSWPRRLPRPFTGACVELAAACGLQVTKRAPALCVDDAAREKVRARIDPAGKTERIILVHAGARPGSAKGIPPNRWAALLRAIGAEDARIVLTCGPGEESAARAVRDLVPRAILLDDPPLDVSELLAAHTLADCVLTADSGSRHLAQTIGSAPIIVLCGPTDPRHTSDHPDRVHVERNEVPCGPCHREVCPLVGDAHQRCMAHTDDRVVAARIARVIQPAPMKEADRASASLSWNPDATRQPVG